jgi:hypothetical protein
MINEKKLMHNLEVLLEMLQPFTEEEAMLLLCTAIIAHMKVCISNVQMIEVAERFLHSGFQEIAMLQSAEWNNPINAPSTNTPN